MTTPRPQFYVTTPIYYVNDAPHIGHCYTTLLADVLARHHRLAGRDTFFLTGTDEHAEKVVSAAADRGLSPIEWADRNAAAFRAAFDEMDLAYDDFIRTTEDRHTTKVREYIQRLMDQGDIALGDYEGWWDPSQEEYITETAARENDFKSPVTGKELVKRTEQNYFFDLTKYESRLLEHIEQNPGFIKPDARRNEVLGRIRQGLQRVPVSRAINQDDAATAWGIRMPGDDAHRVYVWIDALFNYLSVVDAEDRRKYWPAEVHFIAKDILWFHAVIWPCLLMALGEPLPGCVYSHSYWIREGRKMSKSLGNFIDLPTLRAYTAEFSTDAVRWYLLTQGPLGATDADFSYAKFIEVYNADLANGIGNAASRVSNMIAKYFDGRCPDAKGTTVYADHDWPAITGDLARKAVDSMNDCDLAAALDSALAITRRVDGYIHQTEPFKLAKDESRKADVSAILYHCAESLRIAATLLLPAMPHKMADLLTRLGDDPADPRPLEDRVKWGGLKPGTPIEKGNALFPRAAAEAPEPAPVASA